MMKNEVNIFLLIILIMDDDVIPTYHLETIMGIYGSVVRALGYL